jgi:hypothetical protein
MAFQVIAAVPERDVQVGPVRIEFHSSRRMKAAATECVQTETGTMVLSTPETTAFDLVRFSAASGSWSNVSTVISELAETLDPKLLSAGVDRVTRSDVQRLGWLLDLLGKVQLAEALHTTLRGRRLVPTPLSGEREHQDAPLDPRWRVLVNDDLETDQ